MDSLTSAGISMLFFIGILVILKLGEIYHSAIICTHLSHLTSTSGRDSSTTNSASEPTGSIVTSGNLVMNSTLGSALANKKIIIIH